ncbi:signal peptidase II . Aspartic peptidase. MEROPS family A08 [Lentibacillus halodurans]|uniref:Lipoprotein signal peptidase n=1 Tax=Lentibacillus halodurans TaxID=237679 RepID=A0A1I0Z461_9BACI|nr:signal peptidase II [Lentibacillus halodurans]SFB19228.1 signal peptidase II . Aspartic peptidase. MEROPS family A08 [Lentibacillus halodurans]
MYLYYILALLVIAIDQLTKWVIVKTMELGEQLTVIGNFFHLTSHRNSGAAWGILQGQMGFFYIITIIVMIGVIYFMQKYAKENKLAAIALSLILGGAIGNFIDRLFRKEVVDFFDFTIFGYDYPIFNIADSALVAGVILVIIVTIIDERKEKRQNDKTAHGNGN